MSSKVFDDDIDDDTLREGMKEIDLGFGGNTSKKETPSQRGKSNEDFLFGESQVTADDFDFSSPTIISPKKEVEKAPAAEKKETATAGSVLEASASESLASRRKAQEELRKVEEEVSVKREPQPSSAPQTQERILVVGSTGRTGLEVVRLLLKEQNTNLPTRNGVLVRALVRDKSKADAKFGEVIKELVDIGKKKERLLENLEVVIGDVTKPSTLDAAVKDVSAIIFAAGGISYLGFNQSSHPYYIDFEGVKNVAQSAKVHSPQAKMVLISSQNVTKPMSSTYFFNNTFFGRQLNWKWEGEESLRKSGLNYTILRAGGLLDTHQVREENPLIIVGQGDVLKGKVRRLDIAKACIEATRRKETDGATLEIINSKATHPGCSGPSLEFNTLFSSLKKDTGAPATATTSTASSSPSSSVVPHSIAAYDAVEKGKQDQSRWKSKPPGESKDM